MTERAVGFFDRNAQWLFPLPAGELELSVPLRRSGARERIHLRSRLVHRRHPQVHRFGEFRPCSERPSILGRPEEHVLFHVGGGSCGAGPGPGHRRALQPRLPRQGPGAHDHPAPHGRDAGRHRAHLGADVQPQPGRHELLPREPGPAALAMGRQRATRHPLAHARRHLGVDADGGADPVGGAARRAHRLPPRPPSSTVPGRCRPSDSSRCPRSAPRRSSRSSCAASTR